MKNVYIDPRIRESYNDLILLDRVFRANLREKLERIKIKEQNGKGIEITIVDNKGSVYLLYIEIRSFNIMIIDLQVMLSNPAH